MTKPSFRNHKKYWNSNTWSKCKYCGKYIPYSEMQTEKAPIVDWIGGDEYRPPDEPVYAHSKCLQKLLKHGKSSNIFKPKKPINTTKKTRQK